MGLVTIAIAVVVIFSSDAEETVLATEREMVQTAMNAMMFERGIAAVTANDDSTGSNGQNTWTALPVGGGAVALDLYLGEDKTRYFFCWDSEGKVYAQNGSDGERATPDDARSSAACKAAP